MKWPRRLVLGLLLISAPAIAAPPPSGKLVDGRPFAVGNAPVTIVHFWATWCVPCRVEMPKLDAFYHKHHSEGVALVAISLDKGGGAERINHAMQGMAMPAARIDQVKMQRKDIPIALPVTRVYDRSGHLRFDSSAGRPDGTIDFAKLERVVDGLLQEAAANH